MEIEILHYIFAALAIKAITIGSDFSLYHWYKHREIYLNWYLNRETFDDYRKTKS